MKKMKINKKEYKKIWEKYRNLIYKHLYKHYILH